jgi:hypothetical protein
LKLFSAASGKDENGNCDKFEIAASTDGLFTHPKVKIEMTTDLRLEGICQYP